MSSVSLGCHFQQKMVIASHSAASVPGSTGRRDPQSLLRSAPSRGVGSAGRRSALRRDPPPRRPRAAVHREVTGSVWPQDVWLDVAQPLASCSWAISTSAFLSNATQGVLRKLLNSKQCNHFSTYRCFLSGNTLFSFFRRHEKTADYILGLYVARTFAFSMF